MGLCENRGHPKLHLFVLVFPIERPFWGVQKGADKAVWVELVCPQFSREPGAGGLGSIESLATKTLW